MLETMHGPAVLPTMHSRDTQTVLPCLESPCMPHELVEAGFLGLELWQFQLHVQCKSLVRELLADLRPLEPHVSLVPPPVPDAFDDELFGTMHGLLATQLANLGKAVHAAIVEHAGPYETAYQSLGAEELAIDHFDFMALAASKECIDQTLNKAWAEIDSLRSMLTPASSHCGELADDNEPRLLLEALPTVDSIDNDSQAGQLPFDTFGSVDYESCELYCNAMDPVFSSSCSCSTQRSHLDYGLPVVGDIAEHDVWEVCGRFNVHRASGAVHESWLKDYTDLLHPLADRLGDQEEEEYLAGLAKCSKKTRMKHRKRDPDMTEDELRMWARRRLPVNPYTVFCG